MGEENVGLSGQVRESQEKLRMSQSHITSLVNEIENFKNRVQTYAQENEQLKKRAQASDLQ